MSMDNDLFADAARDVLADQCTPHVVRAIEEGGRTAEATTAPVHLNASTMPNQSSSQAPTGPLRPSTISSR